jgi:hypothetical protein
MATKRKPADAVWKIRPRGDAVKACIDIRNAMLVLHLSELEAHQRFETVRMLDSIAETAAELRAEIEIPGNATYRDAFKRRVRRALGYTYP